MSEPKTDSRRRRRLGGGNDLTEEVQECRKNGYILTGKFLGQGAYAKVYLGQPFPEKIQKNSKLKRVWNQDKSLKVAIKIITISSAPHVYVTKFLPREVSTMSRCYLHTNVIQLYDIFASVKRIYLVLEYAECGDLLSYVNYCYSSKSGNDVLTENNARLLFRDILAGINFIHSRGVAHRDLKCENILLARSKRAKLSDFGFAIEPTQSSELLKTHCGSYAYAPPEILKQQRYDGKLADIWSLGVILFAMVNGGLPFKESDAKAVLQAMRKPVYFKEHLTSECKDLIRGLLKIRPHKRISLPEIFSHAWMKPCQRHGMVSLAGGDEFDSAPGGDIANISGKNKEAIELDYRLSSPEKVLKYISKFISLNPTEKTSNQCNPGTNQKTQNQDSEKQSDELTPKPPQMQKESVPATAIFQPDNYDNVSLSDSRKKQNKNQKPIEAAESLKHCNDGSETPSIQQPLPDVHQRESNKTLENCEDQASKATLERKILGDLMKINLPTRCNAKSKMKRLVTGKRSTDVFLSCQRRSATPNIVNIGTPKKIVIDSTSLQKDTTNAGQKFRTGAISVPPQVHHHLPYAARPQERAFDGGSKNHRNHRCTAGLVQQRHHHNIDCKRNITTPETIYTHRQTKQAMRLMEAIPEREELILPKTTSIRKGFLPTPAPNFDHFKLSHKQLHFVNNSKNIPMTNATPKLVNNAPVLREFPNRKMIPAEKMKCSMAAWKEKEHLSPRYISTPMHMKTNRYNENKAGQLIDCSKYSSERSKRVISPESRIKSGSRKLLDKRMQVERNFFQGDGQPMDKHRQIRVPDPSSGSKFPKKYSTSNPPKIKLRLTHTGITLDKLK